MAYTKGMFKDIYKNCGITKTFSAKEVGIHPLTLNAAKNRGLVEKFADGKYRLTSKGVVFMTIENSAKGNNFVSLKKKDADLGMLCIVKGMDILDCWEKPWDYNENVLIFDGQIHEWRGVINYIK